MTTSLPFEKVQQIAALLDGTARPLGEESSNERYYITLAGGESIFIAGSSRARRGRVSVSGGQWPTYTDTGGRVCSQWPHVTWVSDQKLTAPEITCADSKPAEQIAKDIQRRFLPDFLTVWGHCKDAADKNAAYVTGKARAVQDFATTTGGEIGGSGDCVFFRRGRLKYVRDVGHNDLGKEVTYDIELSDITLVELTAIMKVLK